MTNDRIQAWLARAAQQPAATQLETEAREILSFLAGHGGAVQLADDAAWEQVASECAAVALDDSTWWNTSLDVLQAELEPEDVFTISRALCYLHVRGLTTCHASRPELVRER